MLLASCMLLPIGEASVAGAKQRIAILGAGMGGLSTAWFLSNASNADLYDITVYEMGWRLGGKTATGRNLTAGFGQRIEEHGVHLLFGWNEYLFHMLDDTYTELARPSTHPLHSLETALIRQTEVTLADNDGANVPWFDWQVTFPFVDADPWTLPFVNRCGSDQACSLPSVSQMIVALVEFITAIIKTYTSAVDKYRLTSHRVTAIDIDATTASIRRELLNPGLASSDSFFHDTHQLVYVPLLHVLESLQAIHNDVARASSAASSKSLKLPPVWSTYRQIVSIAIASIKAMWNLQPKTWDQLDTYDFNTLLLQNGLPPAYVNGTTLRMIYYSNFNSIPGGDISINPPALSSAVAMYNLYLNTVVYRGAWSYYMLGGTGDTLVQPLYELLVKRGVKFEFFHKIVDVKADPITRRVNTIDIDVQAQLIRSVYEPLITVNAPVGSFKAWPSEPLWSQLANGSALEAAGVDFESTWSPPYPPKRKTLTLGRDFDQVVMAISVGALPGITSQLMSLSTNWTNMLNTMGTTPTYGMQLWFKESASQMGVNIPPSNNFGRDEEYKLLVYESPLDGAADYSHTLPYEGWTTPKNVIYFSSGWAPIPGAHPASQTNYPKQEVARLAIVAENWLTEYFGYMYPAAVNTSTGIVNWNLFVDGSGAPIASAKVLVEQYLRVNVEPTAHYVLSVPGALKWRMKADESTFPNMILAGDWVYNGIFLGAIEGATRAGCQAAAALGAVPFPSGSSSSSKVGSNKRDEL